MTAKDPTSFNADIGQSSEAQSLEASAAVFTPVLQAHQPAPADYYQNTFTEIVTFVAAHYASVIPGEVLHTLQNFLQAGPAEQRLLARLLTRKGPVFFENHLRYREVPDIQQAIGRLENSGLIQRGSDVPADVLLASLTKSNLLDMFANTYGRLARAKSLRKDKLLEHLLGHRDDRSIRRTVWHTEPWCTIAAVEHWQLAQLLYFGRSGQDWSAHVRRDLGQLRYEQVALSQTRFANAADLQCYLRERELSRRVFRLEDWPQLLPGLVADLLQPVTDPVSARLRNRNLLRVGKWCERREELATALAVYERAGIPPSRERRVRILHKLGRHEDSEALRAQMLEFPQSATESVFAQRFKRRGLGFSPDTICWDLTQPQDSVEQYVLQELVAQGGWGIHSENALLKTLTGLIYWQAIFSPQPGAFTNPFQAAPQDLHEPDFVLQRAESIAAIEARIGADDGLLSHMREICEAKRGIANPLVSWGLLEAIELDQWLNALPGDWIRNLSHFLIRNLSDYRKGFPDLFVCYPDGDVELVEVKGPGDQLQPQQRAWFEVFDRLGIRARIIKLRL